MGCILEPNNFIGCSILLISENLVAPAGADGGAYPLVGMEPDRRRPVKARQADK